MAKERKFVSAGRPSEKDAGKTPKGRATGLRIIAFVLWLAAFAFQALAIALLNGVLLLTVRPNDVAYYLHWS